MNINAINSNLQKNNAVYKTKDPSFQAKLEVTPEAYKLLHDGTLKFYQKCNKSALRNLFSGQKFNFEQILTNYKKAVEQATDGVEGAKGTIKLVVGKHSEVTLSPELQFETSENKIVKKFTTHMISPYEILPNAALDGEIPLKTATFTILDRVSDLLSKNGYDTPEQNPFAKLAEKFL